MMLSVGHDNLGGLHIVTTRPGLVTRKCTVQYRAKIIQLLILF